jgi:hypothetical protein
MAESSGLPSLRCPECGRKDTIKPFSYKEISVKARKLLRKLGKSIENLGFRCNKCGIVFFSSRSWSSTHLFFLKIVR